MWDMSWKCKPPSFSLVQDKSGYKVLVAFIYSPRHPQREPKRQHTLIAKYSKKSKLKGNKKKREGSKTKPKNK